MKSEAQLVIAPPLPPQRLVVAGTPRSAALGEPTALVARIVARIADNATPCSGLPAAEIDGEIAAVAAHCVRLAIAQLDGMPSAHLLEPLRDAARQWAREGLPIEAVHRAVHEGGKVLMETVTANLRGDGTEIDFDALLEIGQGLIGLLDTVSATAAVAYLDELGHVAHGHHTALQTLTSALLSGRPSSTMARQCGIEVAERYAVLALALPPTAAEVNPHVDTRIAVRRKLSRVRDEIGVRCGPATLYRLAQSRGTVLLPHPHRDDLADLVQRLSAAAESAITATVIDADVPELPTAHVGAHQLLDMVRRMSYPPALYPFEHYALEFQLTRPGRARRSLAARLAPLDDSPELLATLESHLRHDGYRRQTARELHVHENTVTNRLHRIGELTGVDPLAPTGMWQLRSAVLARQAESAGTH